MVFSLPLNLASEQVLIHHMSFNLSIPAKTYYKDVYNTVQKVLPCDTYEIYSLVHSNVEMLISNHNTADRNSLQSTRRKKHISFIPTSLLRFIHHRLSK